MKQRAPNKRAAFTLIELLTVIAIIGFLAAVTMGVTGLASRKMREKRVITDLNDLAFKIESYKSALGFYPPENPTSPEMNSLFYELSGATLETRGGKEIYVTMNRREEIAYVDFTNTFKVDGILNSARDPAEVKYSAEMKPTASKEFSATPDVELLAAPLKGPVHLGPGKDINPWRYDSSNPTNNLNGFDLWVDVLIGKNKYRYCNWSKSPIRLP